MPFNFMHKLVEGATAATDAGALETWLLSFFQHLSDLVRETGDDVVKTNELAAAIDQHAEAATTAISDKIAELADNTPLSPVVPVPAVEPVEAVPVAAVKPA